MVWAISELMRGDGADQVESLGPSVRRDRSSPWKGI
jgi:hypothetical protein